MLVSQDLGKSWRDLGGAFKNLGISALAQDELSGAIYICSEQGLFSIDHDERLVLESSGKVRSLAIVQGVRYLAGIGGLFKSDGAAEAQTGLVSDCGDIAFARALQEKALRYYQVHPAKITNWRRRIKARALMPKFDIDYDNTMNYDSKTYRYIEGPRDWGVSFSWDLGDLIWNSYEDDIDTRARLDAQMRMDIIDEVNRIYFEYIRAGHELALPQISGQERFARQLRVNELTAALDGYTGGWFSRQINKR